MSSVPIRLLPPSGAEQMLELVDELRVGRGSHNDVVLDSEEVSWSHAVIRLENGAPMVEDLGSTNGTFVGKLRIDRPIALDGIAPLQIADFVFHVLPPTDKIIGPRLQVADLTANLRFPIRGTSFRIGSDEDADMRIPDCPLTILGVVEKGILVNGTRHDLPWEGELGGRYIRVSSNNRRYTPTTSLRKSRFVVEVSLQPPVATLLDMKTRQRHTVTAPNRVYFLYTLGQALIDDRKNGMSADRCGWRSDTELGVAVWGRAGLEASRNRVNTLTHRVRAELESNGFPRDLIEKRDGRARLSATEITVHDN